MGSNSKSLIRVEVDEFPAIGKPVATPEGVVTPQDYMYIEASNGLIHFVMRAKNGSESDKRYEFVFKNR